MVFLILKNYYFIIVQYLCLFCERKKNPNQVSRKKKILYFLALMIIFLKQHKSSIS